ncbi:MAG: phage tail protein [Gammaproteobacteria bacterium]|nr:phage tail protein [Gammaproteobacteria bacterium]MCP5298688.1 phage tail protein [Chromatiaceae bacterium]
MPNRRPFDHIGAFNFLLEIEGVTQGAVLSVDGITARTDVVRFKDGSDTVVRQRPGRNHTDNIIVRRGYTNNDELFNWYDVVRDGRVERKSGSIIIAGDDASEITRFNFFEAWPCRWSLLVFDGDDSTTLIEEIEIAVERIEKG